MCLKLKITLNPIKLFNLFLKENLFLSMTINFFIEILNDKYNIINIIWNIISKNILDYLIGIWDLVKYRKSQKF